MTREGKTPVTIRSYLNNLSLFAKWYRGIYGKQPDVRNVQDVDLLIYRSFLQVQKRRKATTVNRHIASLRGFFSHIIEEGLREDGLVRNLEPMEAQPPNAPETLTHAQVLRLFGAVDKNGWRGRGTSR